MQDPNTIGETIEAIFRRINTERMQGLPLLNPLIEVEAVGFQHYENRVMGIIVTPWLMNLVLLPGADDDWSELQLGDRQWHRIGARQYKFMVNEIDDIGICQTHSLHSPMRNFDSHQSALDAAREFFTSIAEDFEVSEEDLVDEELLGRLMRDEIPAEIEIDQMEAALAQASKPTSDALVQERRISRRALLRGELG